MPRFGQYGYTRVDVLNFQPEATDLTGTGALDLTSFVAGFQFEVEEFGFRVTTALVGGTNIYDLVDSGNVAIASISLVAASGGKAAVIKTTVITPSTLAPRVITDANTLKIRRRAGGTTVSAGIGTFYVRGRQLHQRISGNG